MTEALKKAIARQEAITDAAKTENRDLTEAEQREFDNLSDMISVMTEPNGNPDGTRSTQPDNNGVTSSTQDAPPAPTATPARAASNGYTVEDAAAIANMCRAFGIDAADMLARGISLDAARAEIIARQMSEHAPVNTGVTVTNDEGDKRRRAMVDGIILRSGGDIETPADGSNNYRGLSIREIAVECLEMTGDGKEDYRHMSPSDVYDAAVRTYYNPESAFPSILDDVVKKSYIEGMNKASVTFPRWVKFGTLTNFKKTTNHEYLMSLAGELEKVPENGELKAYVPRDVAMPERQLDTYGRQFTMSRKAFIDDDIGVVTSMPRRFAEMSLRTQNRLIYGILLNNKKIFDGKVLFSADRKNTLTSGTKPTLEIIQKMIYMIGIQKDAAGNQLALMPDIFIVPLGMGVELQKILTTPTIYSAAGTIANPYYNSGFEVIEDVTLNGMIKEGEAIPWFMGVKGQIIQVDYLNGQREATIRRSEEAGKLGFVWDVFHDFGVSMLHPEAICRNPGVTFDAEGFAD